MARMKSLLVICGLLGLACFTGCGEEEPGEQNEPAGDDDDSDDDDDEDELSADASASTGTSRDAGSSRRDAASSSRMPDAAASRDAATLIDAASVTSDAASEPVRDASRADAMADAAGGGAFSLSSSVVQNGMRLANEHRCMDMQNANTSPPLMWTEGPAGTLSYALVMRDITRGVILHWTLYDLPPATTSLPAGVPAGYQPPQLDGAKQGPSYKSALGYQGPCAPSGTNTYEFTLYAMAVASVPGLTQSSSAAQIVSAIEMHDLASAKLTVTSSRM